MRGGEAPARAGERAAAHCSSSAMISCDQMRRRKFSPSGTAPPARREGARHCDMMECAAKVGGGVTRRTKLSGAGELRCGVISSGVPRFRYTCHQGPLMLLV